jgi:deoxyribodipyrimidine photo-lyase
MAPRNTILVWFRNNLRLHDNEAWHQACLHGDVVLPIFIFKPREFHNHPLGFPRAGVFRTRFLLESAGALKRNLQKQGVDLIIRVGAPETVIAEIHQQIPLTKIYTSDAATQQEITATTAVSQALGKLQVTLQTYNTTTLIHENDLPQSLNQLPEVFTAFRKKVEARLEVRPLFPVPLPKPLPAIDVGELPHLGDFNLESITPDNRSALTYTGGEEAARERLNDYIWKKELIATYKETRNELIGSDYSSKLSPALAHGCLSAKSIYHEVKRFEAERIKNDSTYWLFFELLWRDYFYFMAKKYGNKIFKSSGLRNKSNVTTNDKESFERWRLGNTGNDFVDANMRELLHTGFMSNRGRQNVASYLVHDLHLDWTWGAAWFESQLIDYDPCSNWLNWAYVAGVGNDPRENRYFNTKSQAERYDPDGAYRRLWLDV